MRAVCAGVVHEGCVCHYVLGGSCQHSLRVRFPPAAAALCGSRRPGRKHRASRRCRCQVRCATPVTTHDTPRGGVHAMHPPLAARPCQQLARPTGGSRSWSTRPVTPPTRARCKRQATRSCDARPRNGKRLPRACAIHVNVRATLFALVVVRVHIHVGDKLVAQAPASATHARNRRNDVSTRPGFLTTALGMEVEGGGEGRGGGGEGC